jgi:hypothetical protein
MTTHVTLPDNIRSFANGKLFALANPYRLDGRVGSHPTDARGWSAMQCYLFVEDDRALLLNTGYSVHQDVLLAQLEPLVGDRPLDLLIARVEFLSMCNARPIADRFDVENVWLKARYDASTFLNFRPEFEQSADGLRDVRTRIIHGDVVVPIDATSRRQLRVFQPELRLLPCSWVYDEATQTLFSGDIFGWTTRDSPDGPWWLDGNEADTISSDLVADFLLRNRYWWLAGAAIDPLRRGRCRAPVRLAGRRAQARRALALAWRGGRPVAAGGDLVNAADTVPQLPREIAPGVFWLGACLEVEYQGRILHSYNSAFLVAGDDTSVIIEAGITSQTDLILDQLATLEDGGAPEPAYLLVTHSEMAHSGGTGVMLNRYPSLLARGEMTDLHLVFPQFADRLGFLDPGDRIDLGGTEIVVVEGVFRDLLYSRWYFDTRRRILFPGDGFAYGHYHEDGACGHFAEEVPSLDIPHGVKRFTQSAFHWAEFVDIEPFLARLDELVFDELDVTMIAPSHGLPIREPLKTMPEIRAGLRACRAWPDGVLHALEDT